MCRVQAEENVVEEIGLIAELNNKRCQQSPSVLFSGILEVKIKMAIEANPALGIRSTSWIIAELPDTR